MDVTVGGNSRDHVCLEYQFEVFFRNPNPLRIDEVVFSEEISHDGVCWKFSLKRTPLDTDGLIHLECQLHLISGGNAKPKLARVFLVLLPSLSSQLDLFQQNGDRSQPLAFMVNSPKSQVAMGVEVIKYKMATSSDVSSPNVLSHITTQFLQWFQSEDFGDTTIVAADGIKFRCHRDILARRSEVFHLMFSCPMKEARENVVNIAGYEGDIVASVLSFIYTDECQINLIADRLYVAAHHYKLEGLKILCESALTANLSAKSVVKTFQLAKFYHIDQLIAVCVTYLDGNKTELSTADLLAEALELDEANKVQPEQD